jgi:O-antigen ligase/polysaccharide polymerase Wzy-like membrane protein
VTAALAERPRLAVLICGSCGLLLGAFAGVQPKLAAGVVVAVLLLLLAFRAPVANLALLLFLTGIVPYEIQNRFGVGGGVNSPGLLLSDLLLLAGIAWGVLALLDEMVDRRTLVYAVLVAVFLLAVILQFVHGVHAGRDKSQVGAEARVLLGFGTFLIAVPLLLHATTRRKLLASMTVLAVALGGWGMIQWFGHLSYGVGVGVRAGVSLTTSGTGQLQGGEFEFPVAIVMCLAILVSGGVRSRWIRIALLTALVLNAASCLVTFERTFWLDALLGVCLVLVRAPSVQRLKAFLVAPIVIILAIGALAILAPRELTTAHQRLLSIGQYSSDTSVRYRLDESRFVIDRIRAHPVAGSGLAASIFWGRPWEQVAPKGYVFSHDGYLWLAWKVGVPAAALLVLLFGAALFLKASPGEEQLGRALRQGAQGAIAGLLLATITFPTFNNLLVTPLMGLLLAFAVAPTARRARFASPPP